MTQPNPDWQWFGEHPERCHRARLASPAEIVDLQQEQGLDVATLAEGCFIYAVSRIKRDDPPLELQTLFIVLKPQGDMAEAACRQAWHDAADKIITGQIKGQES
jgi:hypothetical protein